MFEREAYTSLLAYEVTPPHKDAFKKSMGEMNDAIATAKAAAQKTFVEGGRPSSTKRPSTGTRRAPHTSRPQSGGAPAAVSPGSSQADELLGRYASELAAHQSQAKDAEKQYRGQTARLYRGTRTGNTNKWENQCRLDHTGFEVLETLGAQCIATLHNCSDIRDLLRMEHRRLHADAMSARERELFPAPTVLSTIYAVTSQSLAAACRALTGTLNRLIATTKAVVPIDNWRKIATLLWQEAQVPIDALQDCQTGEDIEAKYKAIKSRALAEQRQTFSGRQAGEPGQRPIPPALYYKTSEMPSGPGVPAAGPPPPPPSAPGAWRPRVPELLRQWKASGLYVPVKDILPRAPKGAPGVSAGREEGEGLVAPRDVMLCASEPEVDLQAVMADVDPTPHASVQGDADAAAAAEPTKAPQPPAPVTKITCREGSYQGGNVRGSIPTFEPPEAPAPLFPYQPRPRSGAREGSAGARRKSPALTRWQARDSPSSPMTLGGGADSSAAEHSPTSDMEELLTEADADEPEATLYGSVARYREKRRRHYRQLTVKEKEWYLLFNRTEVTLHHDSALNNMRRVADTVSLSVLACKPSSPWADAYRDKLNARLRAAYLQRDRIANLRWQNLSRVRFLDGARFLSKRVKQRKPRAPVTITPCLRTD
eukprot:TRINITY_DN2426_c0_g1_i1.p1 TRINITY_DN2426_c0_g1~~TRINITY_DN2426_c0_g1_i1.p1  ORF type:complete len:653 (+),score=199.02 TRINITY_DN2426_c0_g1_i1:71-2029(+)